LDNFVILGVVQISRSEICAQSKDLLFAAAGLLLTLAFTLITPPLRVFLKQN
jgi:hypothetical protein